MSVTRLNNRARKPEGWVYYLNRHHVWIFIVAAAGLLAAGITICETGYHVAGYIAHAIGDLAVAAPRVDPDRDAKRKCEAEDDIWYADGRSCIPDPLGKKERLAMENVFHSSGLDPTYSEEKIFTVLFELNNTIISEMQEAVLQQAITKWKQGRGTPVVIAGFTDRSLGPDKSKIVSENMANNVAEYLNEKGIPRGSMIVVGRGELVSCL